MLRLLRCYFLLLFCIGLFGCSSTINFKGENKFKPRIRAFAHAIRWSEFEQAKGFIRLRDDQSSTIDMGFLNKIKVTKYEPLSELPRDNLDQDSTDIIAVYTIDYYNEETFIMKRQKYEQIWWYDETASTWFVDSDLPSFR